MTAVQSIILGIIEGLTEYLPVSSTGHLIVAQRLMGLGQASPLDKAAADAFAISIQGGAILAVLSLYFPRVLQMLRGVLGQDREGLRLAIALVCGFLPAAVIGLKFNDLIERTLFGLVPVVIAWIVGGIAILAVARRRKNASPTARAGIELADITWKMALIIGFAQCVAMWPGTSRSLMTIVGGLLVGLSLRAAVEYSFLLGVLTLGAAAAKKALFPIHDLPGHPAYAELLGGARLMLDHYGPLNLALGFLAGLVSAILAVKWMVTYLQRHGMEVFGYYRIGIGLLVTALLLTGTLSHL